MYFCVHMYHDICEVSTSCRSRLSPLFHHVGPSCLFLMSHLASPLIYSLTVFLFVCVCVLSVYQCADPCTCLGGKGADWHALRYCCPPQFWDRISIPFCFSVAVMNHSDLEAACGGKGYFIFQLTIHQEKPSGGHKAGAWNRLMGKYWLPVHSQACFWAHG